MSEKSNSAKLITISQAAAMTNMSQGWWRAAVAGRKPMPPVRVIRIGTAVRLHLGDLLAWIDNGEVVRQSRKRGRPRKSEVMARRRQIA